MDIKRKLNNQVIVQQVKAGRYRERDYIIQQGLDVHVFLFHKETNRSKIGSLFIRISSLRFYSERIVALVFNLKRCKYRSDTRICLICPVGQRYYIFTGRKVNM